MPKGRVASVDATRFAMVPRNDVPRSAFDVRHGHKTTFNAGVAVPLYVEEVLPGDSMRLKMSAFCRLSTPLVPMMDNLEFESAFFFVPNRLVWDNWARFMGEKLNPTDTTTFLVPQAAPIPNPILPSTLLDHFGITHQGGAGTLSVNALPIRAYYLIYNEWFRDQDLQTPAVFSTGDGPDAPPFSLFRVGKRHDYFTSARPWPEKALNIQAVPDSSGMNPAAAGNGFPAWSNPFGQAGVPVVGLGWAGSPASVVSTVKYTGNRSVNAQHVDSSVAPIAVRKSGTAGDWPDVRVLIQDIRTAAAVQQILERNARGGTRYTELMRSHFGVVSPDARLQRPEFLGGGRTMIVVNPVAQTSASGVAGTTTKLGELAAVGSGMIYDHGFSQSFTEHGFIIGLGWIRSFLTYQQGINRMWFRRTQFDYYWPALAHLGEQAILKEEIYADGSANDITVFGYQERWAEYKYKPSRTSGYFRSSVATPLDMWHLGEKFASVPSLNSVFVNEDPPIARVLQVATNFGEDFLFDGLFESRMVRCMPMYSIPGLSGRI